MIRSLLYATDLGAYAPYVLQHALALARSFGAGLYVVHAVEPTGPIAAAPVQGELRGLIATLEQRLLQDLRESLEDSGQDLALVHAVRVLQGEAAAVILDQARRLEVDLLVLGSRCAASSEGPALGHTASRVLQLASAPVYLVPRPRIANVR